MLASYVINSIYPTHLHVLKQYILIYVTLFFKLNKLPETKAVLKVQCLLVILLYYTYIVN